MVEPSKPELCNELCKVSECPAITYGHSAHANAAVKGRTTGIKVADQYIAPVVRQLAPPGQCASPRENDTRPKRSLRVLESQL